MANPLGCQITLTFRLRASLIDPMTFAVKFLPSFSTTAFPPCTRPAVALGCYRANRRRMGSFDGSSDD
jgi:hypothetical protein